MVPWVQHAHAHGRLQTHVSILGSCPSTEVGESRTGKKVYFGLGCGGLRSADTQEVGHSDQVG